MELYALVTSQLIALKGEREITLKPGVFGKNPKLFFNNTETAGGWVGWAI